MHLRSSTSRKLLLLLMLSCVRNRPPTVPIVHGPTCGYPGNELAFTMKSDDPNSDPVYYRISWGDTSALTFTALLPSGVAYTKTHAYGNEGDYYLMVCATDARNNQSDWSSPLAVHVGYDIPERPSGVWGPCSCAVGVPYAWSVSAFHGLGDSVRFQFDWGGTLGDWGRYVASGCLYSETHVFGRACTTYISARAGDQRGLVTAWSESLRVTVDSGAPLVPDKPRGPVRVAPGTVLACTTRTTDPKGAAVSYQFDWGDGCQSAWSEFVASGQPSVDTHIYSHMSTYSVRARARNSRKTSGWSEPLHVTVLDPRIRWSFAFTDPEDPQDSSDFSLNTFGLDLARDAAYIGCEYGALIARKLDRTLRWEFLNQNADEYLPAPSIADDGTVYIGCANDSFYALNPDGTRKWVIYVGEEVVATAAIGTNGTVYVHTTRDSLLAIGPNGNRLWSYRTGGGNSSPVIGSDSTVYAASQTGSLYALDQSSGTKKWNYVLSTAQIDVSPAIDDPLQAVYVADDDGRFASVNLIDGAENWQVCLGEAPSSPVIGSDHTIYVGAGGKLVALNHETGSTIWTFQPPMSAGTVSTPAVSSNGSVYILATLGKKDMFDNPDSLYAVSTAGTRRWATALGEGYCAEAMSAPKLDIDGNIYVGSGLAAWCVCDSGGPALSPWPMFQHDSRNTGRAGGP